MLARRRHQHRQVAAAPGRGVRLRSIVVGGDPAIGEGALEQPDRLLTAVQRDLGRAVAGDVDQRRHEVPVRRQRALDQRQAGVTVEDAGRVVMEDHVVDAVGVPVDHRGARREAHDAVAGDVVPQHVTVAAGVRRRVQRAVAGEAPLHDQVGHRVAVEVAGQRIVEHQRPDRLLPAGGAGEIEDGEHVDRRHHHGVDAADRDPGPAEADARHDRRRAGGVDRPQRRRRRGVGRALGRERDDDLAAVGDHHLGRRRADQLRGDRGERQVLAAGGVVVATRAHRADRGRQVGRQRGQDAVGGRDHQATVAADPPGLDLRAGRAHPGHVLDRLIDGHVVDRHPVGLLGVDGEQLGVAIAVDVRVRHAEVLLARGGQGRLAPGHDAAIAQPPGQGQAGRGRAIEAPRHQLLISGGDVEAQLGADREQADVAHLGDRGQGLAGGAVENGGDQLAVGPGSGRHDLEPAVAVEVRDPAGTEDEVGVDVADVGRPQHVEARRVGAVAEREHPVALARHRQVRAERAHQLLAATGDDVGRLAVRDRGPLTEVGAGGADLRGGAVEHLDVVVVRQRDVGHAVAGEVVDEHGPVARAVGVGQAPDPARAGEAGGERVRDPGLVAADLAARALLDEDLGVTVGVDVAEADAVDGAHLAGGLGPAQGAVERGEHEDLIDRLRDQLEGAVTIEVAGADERREREVGAGPHRRAVGARDRQPAARDVGLAGPAADEDRLGDRGPDRATEVVAPVRGRVAEVAVAGRGAAARGIVARHRPVSRGDARDREAHQQREGGPPAGRRDNRHRDLLTLHGITDDDRVVGDRTHVARSSAA